MSDAVKKAFEEARQKVKDQQAQEGPVPGKIKTPWDDNISKEEQARNSSTTRPDDK
jgi:hypothetical protein